MDERPGLNAFHYGTFRSFEDASMPLGPLTLLVGLNASGKSNIREGIQLMSWMARGLRLDAILQNARESESSVRGQYRDLGFRGAKTFRLGCSFGVSDGAKFTRLRWNITLRIDGLGLRVEDENLVDQETGKELFWLDAPAAGVLHDVNVRYDNFKQGGRKPLTRCTDLLPALTQLVSPAAFREVDHKARERITTAAESLRAQLSAIVLLDPNPPRMRAAAAIGETLLRPDGANLSGVLHGLCAQEGGKEDVLSFVKALPEQAIDDIDFLDGLPGQVMVQVRERFGAATFRDASLLSDGTLRVLAIAAALLTAPEGGTVAIEEIDNGIHPSRASELMTNVHRVATRRALRVLVTSHNPALADALPPEALSDVVVCHRHPVSGDSRLTRLGDIPQVAISAAASSLGRIMTSGELQREIADQRSEEERVQDAMEAIRSIFGEANS